MITAFEIGSGYEVEDFQQAVQSGRPFAFYTSTNKHVLVAHGSPDGSVQSDAICAINDPQFDYVVCCYPKQVSERYPTIHTVYSEHTNEVFMCVTPGTTSYHNRRYELVKETKLYFFVSDNQTAFQSTTLHNVSFIE